MESEENFCRTTEPVRDVGEDQLPDDLLDELDKTLDSLTLESEAVAKADDGLAETAEGFSMDPAIEQMQRTFHEMAKATLAPVARYMKAISLGETSRDLLEISEIVITPLIPKVEAVGLEKHADDLTFFRSLLLLALGERDQTASKAMREVVMEGFAKLSERFDMKYRGYRLAVRNLVAFYRAMKSSDGVSEADIRRFFALGIPSLTWVRRTKVAEMTSLSGILPEVMTEIRRLAYLYRSVPPMRSARLAVEDMAPKKAHQWDVGEELGMDVAETGLTEVSIGPIRGTA